MFEKIITVLFIIFLFHSATWNNPLYGDDFSSNNFQLSYENNRLSISAKKADLKNVLSAIADTTGISIQYPDSLDKKISIKVTGISLQDILERLLKDINYSIVYSGSKTQAAISDIFIFEPDKKTSSRLDRNSNERRITSRIELYERRIESLKKSLSREGENSPRGKSYLRRIKSYENTIEKLREQLN